MKKAHSRMITLACLVLYLSSGPALAQNARKSDQFVINPTRPFVYLQFDHIGDGIDRDNDEPRSRIWLRLTNNCKISITVSANGVPDGSPKDEVGLNYEVVPNRPVSLIAGFPSAKNEPKTENDDETSDNDVSPIPRCCMSEVSSSVRIEPGDAVLFSLPVNHLSRQWHIEIPFQFEVPKAKCCRDPNKWGGEPQMVVSYGLWDLPPHAKLD